MSKTFVEKIMSQKAGKDVSAGAIVSIEPDYVMSHDNAAAISNTFKKIGIEKVKYPDRVVIILDHEIPAPKESSAVTVKVYVPSAHPVQNHSCNLQSQQYVAFPCSSPFR